MSRLSESIMVAGRTVQDKKPAPNIGLSKGNHFKGVRSFDPIVIWGGIVTRPDSTPLLRADTRAFSHKTSEHLHDRVEYVHKFANILDLSPIFQHVA